MPVYEYRCLSCGAVVETLVSGYASKPAPECTVCARSMERMISLIALGKRADPGPGRAAWPTTWRGVNGGDPGTLRYWRHRIERELREEDRNPELSARAEAFRGQAPGPHTHRHDAPPEPFVGPGVRPVAATTINRVTPPL
jgi:putative FmdB family regulatory protein